MKTINEFSPHLSFILREMCRRVNANTFEIDFSSNNWFWDYSWTKEEEKDFRQWLSGYLYGSKAARNEIMATNRKNLKHCRKVADFFVWNHGWKLSEHESL